VEGRESVGSESVPVIVAVRIDRWLSQHAKCQVNPRMLKSQISQSNNEAEVQGNDSNSSSSYKNPYGPSPRPQKIANKHQ
jgi:hypothetical protein